ncbi:Pre-mRNA-splicing factor CWC2 [Pichia kudriavzevii]|uniref:Pre-mRNA-splicing factor CWC2 n=1 Tax=Pichia kudriavzevii TaxID=4909 RepID=A0A1V2LTF7_PICKU|nr:Pre-mRNA-splicing factor CWC2 [Pichia kudriavzevii]
MTDTGPSEVSKNRSPARVQLDPSLVKENSKPDQTGQVFNIWYNKWTGGENNGRRGITHAKHRCNVVLDSGYTRADKHAREGEINRTHYICLYFARGYCCNGKNCDYLHRIPNELDIFSPTVDCFGRERFMDYRDDMSGIGSFGRVNKTLFVSRLSTTTSDMTKRITKAFQEFGELTNVRYIKDKNIAFVTYKLESQAQFAKEAMYCQSLTPGNENETIDIRWANEDQSVGAKRRRIEKEEEMSMEAARKLLQKLKENNSQRKNTTIVTTNEEPGVKDTKPQIDLELKGISIEALQRLKRLRQEQKPSTLYTGYSSSDSGS